MDVFKVKMSISLLFKTLVFISLVVLSGNPVNADQQKKRSTDEWELLFLHCQQQINKHATEYPTGRNYLRGLKDYMPYVHALEVFADDRDKAYQHAQEAQAEGNPYYFNKFMELVDRAQGEGNGVLNLADILLRLEDEHGGSDGWANWCLKSEVNGKPLYDKARERSFDKGITQTQVKILLRASLDHLENGYEYLDSELWPRGEVNPKADVCLSYVERVRKLAKYFELSSEYKDATDMMNRYLKDALCLLDAGHQWYLDLANEYKLQEAKKHIKGFYATLYGKVEVETSGGRKPGAGASVTVTDPHDGKTWEAKTDEKGNYKIKEVILHKDCSPFEITAKHKNCEGEAIYVGPLEEPDPSCEHKKDLLIYCGADIWVIRATLNKRVNRFAEKTESIAEVSVEPDHPLIKEGTYKITRNNSLHSSMSGNAIIHMIVRLDADEGEFAYSGETPLVQMVYGNLNSSDKEERMEYINQHVAEFSEKRTDTFNGSFNLGSFEFHYFPEYKYVSASATSQGQLETEIKKYENEQWKGEPYSTRHEIGIYGACSSDDRGCSITRSKSGYSFSYSETETEEKEDRDFGTITTVTAITLNGTISPLNK